MDWSFRFDVAAGCLELSHSWFCNNENPSTPPIPSLFILFFYILHAHQLIQNPKFIKIRSSLMGRGLAMSRGLCFILKLPSDVSVFVRDLKPLLS